MLDTWVNLLNVMSAWTINVSGNHHGSQWIDHSNLCFALDCLRVAFVQALLFCQWPSCDFEQCDIKVSLPVRKVLNVFECRDTHGLLLRHKRLIKRLSFGCWLWMLCTVSISLGNLILPTHSGNRWTTVETPSDLVTDTKGSWVGSKDSQMGFPCFTP